MNTEIETEIKALSDAINDKVYTDLLDLGQSPELAWENAFNDDITVALSDELV